MNVRCFARPGVPPHAWCAILRNRGEALEVLHGPSVETREDAFFEAAWNGPFDDFDPARSSIVCGTGGDIRHDRVRFTASTDRLSPLFSVRTADGLFVSNSPVFVLAEAGESPAAAYPFFLHDLLRCWRMGLDCPSGPLPLSSGRHLHVHFNTVVTVGRDGAPAFAPHPPGEAPSDYASYRTLLQTGLGAVLKNAADPRRRVRYPPIAAISTGYDSTATATLAAEAGCREAFALVGSAKNGSDSGKENAARLGMTCVEYPRWGYLEAAGRPELEFAIVGTAMPVPLVQLEDRLAGRILVAGNFGDGTWNPAAIARADRFEVPGAHFMSGLAQIEFRLRVGYLVFAPIVIGARHNRAVAGILGSGEMQPWSIGGRYDRPMARRIAEEAGLPRASFGIRKVAGGHAHFGWPGMTSAGSLADYEQFLRERRAEVPAAARAWWALRARARDALWSAQGRRAPVRLPPKYLFGFQWSVERLRERYRP